MLLTKPPPALRWNLAKDLCHFLYELSSGGAMKSFSRADHLKRLEALRDEIDLFRRVCDYGKADAVKRRHRRRTSPRLRR